MAKIVRLALVAQKHITDFCPLHLPNICGLVNVESSEPASFFNPTGSKAVVCAFAHIPSLILTGHESGKVALFDAKTGEEVNCNERAHLDLITDIQLSPDRSYFITSSKDKTARVRIFPLTFVARPSF